MAHAGGPNMNPEAVRLMNALEGSWGKPISYNSMYRDPKQNKAAGGAKGSQHMTGSAFDIDAQGMSEEERQQLISMAREGGFGGVGVYENSLHFDTGPQRDWGPNHKSDSTPKWALASLGKATKAMAVSGGGARRQIDPQRWAELQASFAPQAPVGEVLGTPEQNAAMAQQGPGAPSMSDVANFRSQSELAMASAGQNNRGNIPSGLAHVLDRGVAAYTDYRANKAEKERGAALSKALGGVSSGGGDITDEQISQISSLDPEMGRALMSARMSQQAATRSAAAATAAADTKYERSSAEKALDRASKERIGADQVNVTVEGEGIETDKPAKGWQRITDYDDQGRVAGVHDEVIPGGTVDREYKGKARKSKNTLFSLEQQWKGVDSRIDDAIKMIEKGLVPVTGMWSIGSEVPGTPMYTMKTHLETIRANIGFDKLQDMRENSPTGGALGQVSEMENRLLQATRGSTDQALAGDQLMKNLRQIKLDLAALQVERRKAYQEDWGHYGLDEDDALPEGWTLEGED
jgi:hypothetical protein